jgi:predicted nucleotide-binding protein
LAMKGLRDALLWRSSIVEVAEDFAGEEVGQLTKPRIFLASSSEGLPILRAIQEQLSDIAEPIIWTEDENFRLSESLLESLTRGLDRYDYAIVLFRGDDVVVSRKMEEFAPRDNLLFELGLFMARIGRDRCFVFLDTDRPIKIPTDLGGTTFALFQQSDSLDGPSLSALGPACNKVRRRIDELGQRMNRDRELAVLYRLLNACTYPFYPDVLVDTIRHVGLDYKSPESFRHVEDVVEFVEFLLRDYIHPLLTERQRRAVRVYFAYYIGDGVQFGSPDVVTSCIDVYPDGRSFAGEFVVGLSNPDIYPDTDWRVRSAMPGFNAGRPASNCARVFATGDSSYKNDTTIPAQQAENYPTVDEKSVYSVPVEWRSHEGRGRLGVIAVSCRFPNYIPDALKLRIELLGHLVGYLFSLYAVESLDSLEGVGASSGSTLGIDTAAVDPAFAGRVVALRRRIAQYFEEQMIRQGLHEYVNGELRVVWN